jgi:hypothetical protein
MGDHVELLRCRYFDHLYICNLEAFKLHIRKALESDILGGTILDAPWQQQRCGDAACLTPVKNGPNHTALSLRIVILF